MNTFEYAQSRYNHVIVKNTVDLVITLKKQGVLKNAGTCMPRMQERACLECRNVHAEGGWNVHSQTAVVK